MPVDVEAVPPGQPVLETFDIGVHNLLDASAGGADQVVVVFVVELVLKPGDAVLEGHLAAEAALAEELEGPVDRGGAERGVLQPDPPVDLVGSQVVLGPEEDLQDGAPGPAAPEAPGGQIPLEDPGLRLRFHEDNDNQ